ncbi:hypothetical protein SSX86_027620 [Deinandra increscens subsp. villosa]|uniref:Phytochrome kinase substrate 1 n=1 Tax=Deinandra increscens subsp. villosa TaxID=3103831 RepID=A0AAP0C754_9ASTR
MITSEKRVSLSRNNVDLDASFSDYLNENNPMVLKLTHPSHINSKKKVEDGEIGIFGAEKYFKGAMDEQVSRTPRSIKHTIYHPNELEERDVDQEPPRPKTGSVTPSVRSEASWNSRSGLLVSGGSRTSHQSKREKTSSVKSLLISLGCNCNDNKSIKITENKVLVKEPSGKTDNKILVKEPMKPSVKTNFTDGLISGKKKEDCFSFPVMNTRPTIKKEVSKDEASDIIHVKTRKNSLEGFGSPILEKGKKSFSLERKLTMLNWDGVTPKAENIDMNTGENNDAGSDASSDLFEIESFSTTGNNSFLARQVSNGKSSNATLPNGYAPSEASIAWSVVTASVTEFSIVSEDSKVSKNHNMMKGSGMLSGCNSHKSVRVSGEHVAVGGGEKAAVSVSATVKDRCRLDTMMPVMKSMSSYPRGHSPRASHHLYIQQQ